MIPVLTLLCNHGDQRSSRLQLMLYLLSNVAYLAPANPADFPHGFGPTDRRADINGTAVACWVIQLCWFPHTLGGITQTLQSPDVKQMLRSCNLS